VTTAPPPGWYTDPEAAGRQWRWWDGGQWAPPGYGQARACAHDPRPYAVVLEQQAQATRNAGRWLQWLLVAYSVAAVLGLAVGAIAIRDMREALRDDRVFDGARFGLLNVVAAPLQLVSVGFIVMLIAWIYNAGKFAELRAWPSVRNRTLGAVSVIIPIVNLWWPYEALRDSYPPGARPRLLLRWWLAYLLIVPIAGLALVIAALAGAYGLSVVLVIVAAVVAPIPAVLGWRLVDDLDAMQRVQLAR
jgi:hypothetical protein